jgi:predicted MFS family arabinose efflux permease
MKRAITSYLNNFRGFSREIWILALITFINRAGTMVLPFLSKYLKEDLDFSYAQVGYIMVCFGLGSMLGSYIGGKLTDKFGFYRIMIFSLMVSGFLFLALSYIHSFVGLCIGMFVIMTVADMFRPAMFVSINSYAKPESTTRALTLVRLAVNLGFAAGPALGGLIIMTIGYFGLFWVDGLTCITAISIFWLLVKEKKKKKEAFPTEKISSKAIRKDTAYWVFLVVTFLTSLTFFQLFTTLPLYHKEQFGLTELQTGLLMTLNGLLVVAFEMPLVNFLEKKGFTKVSIVLWGSACMAIGFYGLMYQDWVGILLWNILFLSFGEMFAFPFSNAFVLQRSSKGNEGIYMGYYTMSFSLAHILSSKIGMDMIATFGYYYNWLLMGVLSTIAIVLAWWVEKRVNG